MMLLNLNLTGNTVAYILDGVMDITTLNNFWHQILQKLVEFDTVNLYIEDSDDESFMLNTVLIVALFPIEYADKFQKIAFVTESKGNPALEKLKGMLSRVSIKSFKLENRKRARSWVTE